jgi:sugar lactone lactonase YvrE
VVAGPTLIDIEDLRFPEGPRWHDGALWFSDQCAGVVRRVSGAGAVAVVAEIERPSGLGFLSDGDLLVATMHSCRLLRVARDGAISEYADLSSYCSHLNDMYVGPTGRAYVNAYGDAWNVGDLVLVDGSEVSIAATELAFPNGVAITPDERTLIVSETYGECLTGYDVAADGSLSHRRVWAPLPGRYPDGLCLDAEGAAWVASYRADEFIRVREGGEIVETVTAVGGWALAPCLGGDTGHTLYMCSSRTNNQRYLAGQGDGFLAHREVAVEGVGRP